MSLSFCLPPIHLGLLVTHCTLSNKNCPSSTFPPATGASCMQSLGVLASHYFTPAQWESRDKQTLHAVSSLPLLWHWVSCTAAALPSDCPAPEGIRAVAALLHFISGWEKELMFAVIFQTLFPNSLDTSSAKQPASAAVYACVHMYVCVCVHIVCSLSVFLCFGVWRLGKWDKAKWMLCLWISDCEYKFLLQMKQKRELFCICIIKSEPYLL